MMDNSKNDYTALDRPEVLLFLFHPRPEPPASPFRAAKPQIPTFKQTDVLIPVEDDVSIGARFHTAETSACNILFFHGNGEIVADYDDLGAEYNRMGINFLAADYRGYGRSTGKPTVTSMMRDCHTIFEFVINWLQARNFSGPLVLMGRSLGSASVLELAAAHKSRVDGLIVESGFAYAGPLLQLLGVDPQALGFKEEAGFRNVEKIATFEKPTLVIHAEFDHIIPFSDGRALFDACISSDKNLLMIPGANHNDIFLRGAAKYMTAVKKLTASVMKENA
jgi:fermentation-respiration switch protein FrsA (DUF1100 family)